MSTQRSTPTHTRTHRVNISITEERLAALDAYAKRKGWARSVVIAKLVDRLTLDPGEQTS